MFRNYVFFIIDKTASRAVVGDPCCSPAMPFESTS